MNPLEITYKGQILKIMPEGDNVNYLVWFPDLKVKFLCIRYDKADKPYWTYCDKEPDAEAKEIGELIQSQFDNYYM